MAAVNEQGASRGSPRALQVHFIVLAGGQGTRMKSPIGLPKVLHQVNDKSILERVLTHVHNVLIYVPDWICTVSVVVSPQAAHQIQEAVKPKFPKVLFPVQPAARGTGHAVQCAMEHLVKLHPNCTASGSLVMIVNGDMPFINSLSMSRVLARMLNEFFRSPESSTGVMGACRLPDPTGYGRVMMTADGSDAVTQITEQRDLVCKPEEAKEFNLVNLGLYAFQAGALATLLPLIEPFNAQNEWYLTDTIKLADRAKGSRHPMQAVIFNDKDVDQWMNINTPDELQRADRLARERYDLCHLHMKQEFEAPLMTKLPATKAVSSSI